MRFRANDPTPRPSTVPVLEPDDSNTMYALVRRNPRGGYAVVIGLIEDDKTPTVAEDDPSFMTLAGAVRFAQSAGFYSIAPECFRPPVRLVKGL